MAGNIDYFAIDNQVLNVDDLSDVLEELAPIGRRADNMGIALGLSAGSFEPTMKNVIKTWLDQDYNTERHQLPSYRRLVKAVASKVGGSNPALANEIATNHPATSAAVQSDDHVVTTTQPPPEAKPLRAGANQLGKRESISRNDPSKRVKTAALQDDDQVMNSILPPEAKPLPTSASRETDSDGIGDFLQKLLPRKPKELPPNLQPYPMTKSPHGLCLIINNKYFKELKTRRGSEVDEESLSKLFPKLGYKLHEGKSHRDCKAEEMISLVRAVAEADHSKYDSVVLFFDSHGNNGYLYGSDERVVSIEQIQEILTNSKNLLGKPKIIFIQACRNQRSDGKEVQEDGDDDEENLFIPRDSDFFFAYATTPNTKAFRFSDTGSWYVIELCKIMEQYYTRFDLHRMVIAVHYELANNKEYMHKVKKNGKLVPYKQAPQLVSTLTHPVHFKMDS